MKLLPLLILIITVNLFPQNKDSVNISKGLFHSDSLKKAFNDSLSVNDTTRKQVIIDTLHYYYQKPLCENDKFIDHKTIIRLNYRNTGDILKLNPFTFVRDYGSIGHPDEVMFYGTGYNSISYLQDGILFNNRLTNSLDVNFLQSESVDSIEIIPVPRGFLYGPYTNFSAVNLITQDFLSKKPYTRIKYYQGAYGEAFVDGNFNARILKRLNASFDISNKITGKRYINSAYSLWQANVKLKYFLSSKFNLLTSYSFVHSKVGLNGGVDIDSILASTSNIDSVMYDEILAPVKYPNRDENFKRHFFNIRLLGSFINNTNTSIDIYYKFFREDITNNDLTSPKVINKNKVYGFSLRQNYTRRFFHFNLNANYEYADLNFFNYPVQNSSVTRYVGMDRVFSLSAAASATLLDSNLTPSIFYKFSDESTDKYLNLKRNVYQGIGFDLNYNLLNFFRLYAGYSVFQTAVSSSSISNWQIGTYADFNFINLGVSLFSRDNFVYPQLVGSVEHENYLPNMTGIGGNLKLKFWEFDLDTKAAYYKQHGSSAYFVEFPKISGTSGLYYEDILFNSNLNLKTGFILRYTGKMRMPALYSTNQYIAPSLTVDFSLSGVIQNVAIVYFTWENLFNKQYYLIPYYPMPLRNLRFGIAWELFD